MIRATLNLPVFKRASLIVDKRINHITLTTTLLICHGFGVVVIDINREEVKDTYFIGEYGAQENLSTSIVHNYIYAATTKGSIGQKPMNQILPTIIPGKNYPLTHSLILIC